MVGVQTLHVAADEDGLRLDRWFKRRFPDLGHGRLQKWLRTGQVRVDGARAKTGTRLAVGQAVRVPPFDAEQAAKPKPPSRAAAVSDKDAAMLHSRVLYRDADVLVLDKPAGLAVQGGSGTSRHLDGMLDALRFDAAERPRLVHRLDKDTSGVLVLGRNARAAAKLAAGFRSKKARKLYWALVVGVPKPLEGRIDAPLSKLPGRQGERMALDEDAGKRALTYYRVVEKAARKAAWLALEPLTGRTHQLRVHCALLGTPIQGDGKYGGQEAYLVGEGVSRKLHLHARTLRIPHPDGSMLETTAPLPEHMVKTFEFLGFDMDSAEAGFVDLERD